MADMFIVFLFLLCCLYAHLPRRVLQLPPYDILAEHFKNINRRLMIMDWRRLHMNSTKSLGLGMYERMDI